MPSRRTWVSLICTAIFVAAAPKLAHAQWPKVRGAAGLELDVEYTRFDPKAAEAPSDYVSSGINLWGSAGRTMQFLLALDLHMGGAVDGGFAYELDFYPFGIGLQLGSVVFAGVAAGIGFSGVTSEIPFARQLPIKGLLQLNLHKRLHLEGYAIGKLIGARARNGGSDAVSGFDEIKAGVVLRIGKGGGNAYQRWGNGYFVGATYSELLGIRSYGAVIGYSISLAYDMGGRWRKHRRPRMPRVRPTKKPNRSLEVPEEL